MKRLSASVWAVIITVVLWVLFAAVVFAQSATPSVALGWTASTTSGVTYNVYRNGVLLNTAPVSGTSFTDTTVTYGNTYVYTVRAVLSGNESASSNEIRVAFAPLGPAAPTNLGANVTP